MTDLRSELVQLVETESLDVRYLKFRMLVSTERYSSLEIVSNYLTYLELKIGALFNFIRFAADRDILNRLN